MGKRKRSGSYTKTDDSGAKKSDDCDSQEELDLENVSPLIRGIGSNATRCSARVQEKQEKLRREASPSKQIIAAEVQCTLAGVCSTSATTSVVKGSTKNPSPASEDPPGCHIPDSGNTLPLPVGFEEKRKKRNWELWSVEDKQLFFEALNEFGKDFDAIQNYLATKLKTRSSKSTSCGSQYASKNKDQVRHFYYRTWNKISKYLHFPKDMKKANQELYGLVNYGELRKKQRVLNSKSAVKLCELVDNGITSIKFRGKTCRIKTPVCRALKRLNGLEDVEHTRVPHKVGIELIPADGKTWRCVQNVSHNPRTKVIVNLQRTLASIILFFEDRWKRSEDRLKEKLSSVFGKPRPRLRLIPLDKREMGIPVFKVAENTSSTTICLRSYTENVLCREKNEDNELVNPKLKRKRKQSGSGANVDPNCNMLPSLSTKKSDVADYGLADGENSDVESQFIPFCPANSGTALYSEYSEKISEENSNEAAWMRFQQKWHDEEEMYENTRNRNHDRTDLMNATTETDNDELDQDIDDGIDKLCACGSSKPESVSFVSHVWEDDRIKLGWTAEEAGVMTVGEVYLMLGQTEKLCFEYCWDIPEEERKETKNLNLLNRLIATARFLKKKKPSRSKAALSSSPSSTNGGCPLINCSNCGSSVDTKKVGNNPKENQTTNVASTSTATNVVHSIRMPVSEPLEEQQVYPVTNPTINTILPQCQEPPSLSPSAVSNNGDPLLSSVVLQHDNISGRSSSNSIKLSESFDYPETPASENDDNKPEEVLGDYFGRANSNESEVVEDNPGSNINDNDEDNLSQVNALLPTPPKNTNNQSGGLIELSSIATTMGENCEKKSSIIPNITAILLPPSSTIVTSASGTISISYANKDDGCSNSLQNRTETVVNGGRKDFQASCLPLTSDMIQQVPADSLKNSHSSSNTQIKPPKEHNSFRRPPTALIPLRPKESVEVSQSSSAPKPFLDLPKGNRRLGRRPNFKRVVVPRVLPLLPKQDDMVVRSSIPLATILTVTTSDGDKIGSNSVLIPVSTITTIPSGTPIATLPGSILNKPLATYETSDSRNSETKIQVEKQTEEKKPGVSGNSKLKPNSSESRIYNEAFLSGMPSSISCSSSDFEDLLKVRRQGSNSNMGPGDIDGLSLSSFMEISLPESARMTANECINTDLHIDDLENSNCSLSLSNILNTESKSLLKELATPEPSPKKEPVSPVRTSPGEVSNLPSLSNFDNPWHYESGDMSLSNIFGNYESGRGTSGLSEGDMNFQSIMGDGPLDFASKIKELAPTMSDNTK